MTFPLDSFVNTADPAREKQSFQIRAEQDFILFGRVFSDSFLQKENSLEVSWFAQDGDCVLKGQTFLRVFASDGSSGFSSLLKAICYLSGTATLVRCYTENAGDFAVLGSISKNAPFPEWEKKAIHAGGGMTDLSCVSCSSEKTFPALIKKNPTALALDISVFSEADCAVFFQEIPKEIKRGICGPILPEDMMRFLSYSLDFIKPSFLQGGFPSVKLRVTED